MRQMFLVTFLTAVFAVASFAQSTPKAAIESFYKFDRSHSQIFNRRNIDARKRWFSPTLYSLFLSELRRQTAYLKKNPTDKPYFGDGLPFQPYDETCRAGGRDLSRGLRIREEFLRAGRAAVTATFAFPKACTDGEPVVYTIGLIKSGGGWVIDDVNYGEDTTLKQRLRRKDY